MFFLIFGVAALATVSCTLGHEDGLQKILVTHDDLDTVKAENMDIAFSAYFIFERFVNPGQIVVFDRAEYDFGNNYNNITGEFTCPMNGTYSFTWDLRFILDSRTSYRGWLDLFREQNVIGSIYTSYTTNDGTQKFEQVSNTLEIYCAAGETVYSTGFITSSMYGDIYYIGYSSFSGYFMS